MTVRSCTTDNSGYGVNFCDEGIKGFYSVPYFLAAHGSINKKSISNPGNSQTRIRGIAAKHGPYFADNNLIVITGPIPEIDCMSRIEYTVFYIGLWLSMSLPSTNKTLRRQNILSAWNIKFRGDLPKEAKTLLYVSDFNGRSYRGRKIYIHITFIFL